MSHADAMFNLLRPVFEPLGYGLYNGETPGEESEILYPYAVLWHVPALRQSVVLRGYAGEIFTRVPITFAGLSPRDVAGIADRGSAALHRVRPVIPGRRCGDIEQEQLAIPAAPRPDPNVMPSGRLIYYLPLAFELYSSAILHP